ncbi:MAG: hypothetical protein WAK15_02255 [Candidatus Cybelea sp.]
MVDVHFDGTRAQPQLPRDLFIAQPKSDELQYVLLALRQGRSLKSALSLHDARRAHRGNA